MKHLLQPSKPGIHRPSLCNPRYLMWILSMNLIESSFDVTTAKRASAHPVFNVSYPGYVVLIIYGATDRRLISRIEWNPEQPHFIYRQERYTNKPPFGSTVALLPLHCARSRLKSMPMPWGHVRITILSTKTGPGNNSKRAIAYRFLYYRSVARTV